MINTPSRLKPQESHITENISSYITSSKRSKYTAPPYFFFYVIQCGFYGGILTLLRNRSSFCSRNSLKNDPVQYHYHYKSTINDTKMYSRNPVSPQSRSPRTCQWWHPPPQSRRSKPRCSCTSPPSVATEHCSADQSATSHSRYKEQQWWPGLFIFSVNKILVRCIFKTLLWYFSLVQYKTTTVPLPY